MSKNNNAVYGNLIALLYMLSTKTVMVVGHKFIVGAQYNFIQNIVECIHKCFTVKNVMEVLTT